jgi:hypothetical protein
VFRFVKRFLIMAGIGAVVRRFADSRSQGSRSRGAAQWPPINTRRDKQS